jgi:hypothetical protein
LTCGLSLILAIKELLVGKELEYPRMGMGTFKKAQRKGKGSRAEQRRV